MDLYVALSSIIVFQAVIIASLLINGTIKAISPMTADHNRTIGASDMNPLNTPDNTRGERK